MSVLGLAPLSVQAQQQPPPEELRVFFRSPSEPFIAYSDASNALYRYLAGRAEQYLSRRAEASAALRTREDWLERQRRVRETLIDVVGPFPDRTPLNARVTGTAEREGVRVEKVIFESVPGFHVTAGLFMPEDVQESRPGIVYFSGHSTLGFRGPAYQNVILNLVRKGFVVLAIDPVGQGERLEYIDEVSGDIVVGPNTKHHSYSGAQLFLTGSSQAKWMIWDGIRAIDYLSSRPEVDPDRIGVTGRSGGGTQSAYVAAFDERVLAAAPENYITSFHRLWDTRGPQDAEQNFYHGISSGLDHGDLLLARAPKPTLLLTTTRDIFSIQGSRETFAEMQPAFAALGEPDALQMVEDDDAHASTLKNREALYAFFQESLSLPGPSQDEATEPFPAESLQVSRTGFVVTSLEGETTFTLARGEAEEQLLAIETSRRNGQSHIQRAVLEARRLSGYRDPGAPGEPLFMGRYQRDGYAVEKYLLPTASYPLPYLLLVPSSPGPHPAVIYLHPEGKAAHAAVGGEMEQLVQEGYVVAAPDLIGTGELGPGLYRGDSYDVTVGTAPYGLWFGATMVGESFVGLQAADVVRVLRVLRARGNVADKPIRAVAYGTATPVLQYAAAFEPDLGGIALVRPLISYGSMATTRYYGPEFVAGAVAGMLTAYDLPDLTAAIAPRDVLIVSSVGADGDTLPIQKAQEALGVAISRYRELGAAESLQIRDVGETDIDAQVRSWLRDAGLPGPAL